MPELRRDPVSGSLVIVAAERALRPHTTVAPTAPSDPRECPFCPGHEAMTPPEVYRTGDGAPDTPGWRVRVVPNLYPIVGGGHAQEGTTGAHEVIVLSPDHECDLAHATDDVAVEFLVVLRDRARFHLDAGRAYVQVLVNHGRAAGASIAHPHGQLVALAFVPPGIEHALARFDAASTDLVVEEAVHAAAGGFGIIDGPAPVWAPPAAPSAFLVRVAHRSTRARFDEATDAELRVVALALRDALAREVAVLGDVAYNVVVHTAPPGRHPGPFHWWIDVVPRTAIVAAFEAGTGVLVNASPPEQTAALLRDAAP